MILGTFFRNRYRAGASFLAVSATVAIAVFAIIYFVFYPWGLFETIGGLELFFLITLIDLVIGPVLVTIVFKPGKKGLLFDLVVIAGLQVAALVYGLHVLYLSRPAYIVFVKDRFEFVRANDLSDTEVAKGTLSQVLPVFGPRLVAANLPKDPKDLETLIFGSFSGIDVQHFPRYYVDYRSASGQVRANALPIARLRELNPGKDAYISRLLADAGKRPVAYLPFKADKREAAALIDEADGSLIRVAPLTPWK